MPCCVRRVSRAGKREARRGCLGSSTLTSCPAGTVKDLYEAACDLLQGGLGWWCLFSQIIHDPGFTFCVTAWCLDPNQAFSPNPAMCQKGGKAVNFTVLEMM